MDKHLVNSEQEYLELFNSWENEEVEIFLNIEFAYADGTYLSDIAKGFEVDESQILNKNHFRKNEDSIFPKIYPCVVLLIKEDTFDRLGDIKIQDIEFVYLSDFKL
jgi:hypothetical protein